MSLMKNFSKMNAVKRSLLLAAGLPVLILVFIYLFQGLFPFGNQTILTVDLGQQYIDFFQYYRETLLGNWQQIFYSFQKGMGGEMVGTWTYYLMSPFNLLLLPFPQKALPLACVCLVLAKSAAASASFLWLLYKNYGDHGPLTISFACFYSLMGYFSANQLNIMWLDGLVFLPLIILGIQDLIHHQRSTYYIISLALLLIANYYIGYMVCLFAVLFFLYELFGAQFTKKLRQRKFSSKQYFTSGLRFTLSSVAAAGLAAFSIIPTYFALAQSKGSYQDLHFDWSFAYPLWQVISKLVVGPFNFDQMPEGLPNIFVPSLAILSTLVFFLQKRFSWQEKLMSFFVLTFLLLSMNVKALNLIWHGFQYPIWYPYRFSFVFSFFVLYLAYRTVRQVEPLGNKPAIVTLCLIGLSTLTLALHYQDFSYISPNSLLFSTIAFVFSFFGLYYLSHSSMKTAPLLLLSALALIESMTNTALTLNSISYLNYDSYAQYLEVSQPLLARLQDDSGEDFYRIAKTFQRTKNDPMQLSYYGLDHFNSTIERSTTELFKALGQPTTTGSVNYSNGSLVTDSLFNVRYLINSQVQSQKEVEDKAYERRLVSHRPDFNHYPLLDQVQGFSVFKNPYALSLGFLINEAISQMDLVPDQPIDNQDKLLAYLNDQDDRATKDSSLDFFQVRDFKRMDLTNLESDDPSRINTSYHKTDLESKSFIDFTLKIDSKHAYYLTVPGDLSEDDVTYYLDGKKLNYDKSYNSTQVFNIANQSTPGERIFTIEVKADSINLSQLNLYSLANQTFDQVMSNVADQKLHINRFADNHIKGSFEGKTHDQALLLTIPYNEGWRAQVNGKKVNLEPVLDRSMMVIKEIPQGENQLELRFRPQGLTLGVIISLIHVLVLCLLYSIKRK
ncbi:YfhO family protein [Aerococcus mictus]|nr:YfhO family protein [Aerococcus mictus]RAV96740.1 hypothetical protein DBT53_01170 [Aerococcus mictus]